MLSVLLLHSQWKIGLVCFSLLPVLDTESFCDFMQRFLFFSSTQEQCCDSFIYTNAKMCDIIQCIGEMMQRILYESDTFSSKNQENPVYPLFSLRRKLCRNQRDASVIVGFAVKFCYVWILQVSMMFLP